MELRTQDDSIRLQEHHTQDDSISLPDLATVFGQITDADLCQMFHNLTSEEDLSAVPRVFRNADPRIVPTIVTAERMALALAQEQAPAPEIDPESQSVAVTFDEPTQASAPENNPSSEPVVERPNQASAPEYSPRGVPLAEQRTRASTSGHNPEIESVAEWLETVEEMPASEHGPEPEAVVDTSKQPIQVSTSQPARRRQQYPRLRRKTGFRAFCSRTKNKLLLGTKCLFACCYLTICVLITPEQP
ncbi:hypothetical protein LEL_09094 [Akanthomyces lecanii RCEF 1005]|uniref:Uncharacterized protein n=1 Tax=Akanthomyces lecanii RCEF 1005 TaxID=1081108 RepID=A0A162MWV5_CORDF|nr:hypothetical protein LEL_09094 [Akanthomyces lecanii RCEF 1005]